MASASRIFYAVIAAFTTPSPATGYLFSSGSFGPGSGINTITQLQRVQSITNGWNADRTDILQMGAAGALDRVIINPLVSSFSATWDVADLVNEYNIGMALNSGTSVGILTNFVNKSAAEKNYFIAIAPPGVDAIGYTGQSQAIEITNGYVKSYSTRGSVGQVPTASITVEGYNWATFTGSQLQQNQAVEPVSGSVVTGNYFTLPIATSGQVGSTSVIRPAEIQVIIGNSTIGLDPTALNIENYEISVDTNLENLLKLGNKYPYSKEIRFPVKFSVTIGAYWSNLLTGSINSLFCADTPYNLVINLYQPCSTVIAAQYTATSVKLDSQEISQLSVGDLASTVSLKFDGVIGLSSTGNLGNLSFSGII